MKAPFKHGDRVRYLGSLYGEWPQPVLGIVSSWNPLSGLVSVLWDSYAPWTLLEHPKDLEVA